MWGTLWAPPLPDLGCVKRAGETAKRAGETAKRLSVSAAEKAASFDLQPGFAWLKDGSTPPSARGLEPDAPGQEALLQFEDAPHAGQTLSFEDAPRAGKST